MSVYSFISGTISELESMTQAVVVAGRPHALNPHRERLLRELRQLLQRVLESGTSLTPEELVAIRDCAVQLQVEGASTRADGGVGPAGDTCAMLFAAIQRKDLDTVRRLLDRGRVSVRTRNEADGRMPLHAATMVGSYELLRLLIARGASGAARDYNGHTALYTFCMHHPWNELRYERDRRMWNELCTAHGGVLLSLTQSLRKQDFGILTSGDMHALLDRLLRRAPLDIATTVLSVMHDTDVRPANEPDGKTLLHKTLVRQENFDDTARISVLLDAAASLTVCSGGYTALDFALEALRKEEHQIGQILGVQAQRAAGGPQMGLSPRLRVLVLESCAYYCSDIRNVLLLVTHIAAATNDVAPITLNAGSREIVRTAYIFDGLRDFADIPVAQAYTRLRQRAGVLLTEAPTMLYAHIQQFYSQRRQN